MLDIDKMLEKCGDFNRYQFMLMGLFSIVNVLASMHYYSQTIISFVPEHWCYDDSLQNLTIDEIRKIYSTYNDPHCTPLNDDASVKYIKLNLNNYHDDNLLINGFKNNEINHNECKKWIYNWDFGYISMTGDLNWVCKFAWKSSLGQSLFFVGSVTGTLIFGILADKIGRLPVLIFAFMMALLGNGVTIFTTTPVTFSIARFISGMATDSNFVMMYILVMEYIRPTMRTLGLNLVIGIFYCLGSMATPWIAVGVGNWKLFLVATVTPMIIIPGFYFIVPESAQWLIAKKKYEKAIKCFERVAKFNGRILDKEWITEFKNNSENELNVSENSPSMIGLFRTPRLRRHTLILFFKSMVITLCYDAISRNVEGLGLSPFIMFSLSATAILPACVVLLLLQDKIGRKAMASSSLLVSGIFTASTGIIIAYQKESSTPNTYLLVALAVIGRFGVTVAYNSGAQYATELIPTCVRAQGVAAVHVAGYALTFFSAHILYLSHVFKALPALILGTLSLAGAFLCLFLPETLNRTLPCTLSDGENFGRGERILDFSCFERKKTESTLGLANE